MKRRQRYSAGSLSDRRRIVVWGTSDLEKPRTRIMIASLESEGFELLHVRANVWGDTLDRSQLSRARLIRVALRLLVTWPILSWRYLRAPRHDAVVVGYFGHLDVLVIGILARMRGVPVIWDAFISLYDTIVEDRRMIGRGGVCARSLHALERLAGRLASVVVLDTRAHARYFSQQYKIPIQKMASVMVGCDDDFRKPYVIRKGRPPMDRPTVLFYGQFIPLHGIDVIVDAARLDAAQAYEWHIVGTGQEAGHIRAMLSEHWPGNLRWTKWIPYADLVSVIASADVCLGIFGTSDKAGRVIPNKVFQILATGKPLVTRESEGMRELVTEEDACVELVTPGDPAALLKGVQKITEQHAKDGSSTDVVSARFARGAIAAAWRSTVEQAIELGSKGA